MTKCYPQDLASYALICLQNPEKPCETVKMWKASELLMVGSAAQYF